MIGYIEKTVDYFKDRRPKKAQAVPAYLFYREEGMGIFREAVSKTVSDVVSSGFTKLKHVPFDLFIAEKHSLKFRVSDHPLQDGSTISDHVHRELREVTVEGMFTNHPIRQDEPKDRVTFKDEFATSEVKQSVTNTALAKFEELKRLADARKPVRLVCSLEIYPKMVITAIDYDRDKDSGSAIRFTMTLRELKTVSLKSVTGTYDFQPDTLKTANDRLIAANKKAGKRTAEEEDAYEAARQMKKSIDTEVTP